MKKQRFMRCMAVFIALLLAFCAYMMSTTLEEVLYDERGVQVVTHSDDSSN